MAQKVTRKSRLNAQEQDLLTRFIDAAKTASYGRKPAAILISVETQKAILRALGEAKDEEGF